MSEIIQKWIKNCIGVVMNMAPEVFTSDVMDGTILARILFSYQIITQDQLISILPTASQNIAFRNLKWLGLWLKPHDIICSEEELYEISMGKGSTALKLFYQLYLELHDKDKVDFIAKKRAKQRLHPNFDITPVKEVTDDPSDIPDHPLSKPLVLRKDVIDWSVNRYETLLENYDVMRENYSKYLDDKYCKTYPDKFTGIKTEVKLSPKEIDELNKKLEPIQDYTYEELLEQENAALKMETFKEDPTVAKKIVKTIKQKHRKQAKENEIKLYEQKLLLMEFWEKLVSDQEKEFEESISKKMLKQSVFEKQMVTKMFDVRQQKQCILENRRFIDDEVIKKREAEFLENVFLREKSICDQKYNYYFERNRALELHRRLYAEKKRLKAERNLNMCKDIMNAIVDLSIKHVEYKKDFDDDVPDRVQNEWANLFIKGQPMFNFLNDVEDLVQDTTDLPEELEEIYSAEMERQNNLDQGDFDNYFNYEWPWNLQPLLSDYENKLVSIELGMNVLGHDAHRVLLVKYPKPKPPPKPNIPKVTVAACINGLPDMSILPILQKLLDEKCVKIIEIQEAINYCTEAFNTEIRTEYIDIVLIQETNAALGELKKGKGGNKKGKSASDKKSKEKPSKGAKSKGAKSKKGPEIDDSMLTFPKSAEKQCQTPIIYPCEEIVLSPKGELGKMAYDLLNIGEPLTDILVVAMFVEYLKSLKEIKGWVLMNYPTTIEQAALLEEALTGIQVPGISSKLKLNKSVSIGDIADLEYRESQWEKETENARLRKSLILPNPDPPRQEPFYDTYFTAYIRAQLKIDEIAPKKTNIEEEEETNEELDPLEEFYMDQGCNYAFFYKTFELATIKHLAKLIIGEYTIPAKTSLELFGDTILYIEANLGQGAATPGKGSESGKKGSKKEAPKQKASAKSSEGDDGKKKGKDDKKGKGDKKSKEGKKGKDKKTAAVVIVAITREDKETQMPEIEPEIEEIPFEPPPQPKAGEFYWQYSDLPFPEHFQIALATLWEKAEDVYLCDLKQLFFIKRIILNACVPYATYVKQHMQIFITRPDDKQNYLHKFQSIYNEIDADMRDDQELKAEIHCRIAEFREKLFEICDSRMKESELERQRIIDEDWVPLQACELTNNITTSMQLEIDRACDTYQFLTDYYVGIITKMPSDESPLQKITLKKLDLGTKVSIGSIGGKINMEAINTILRVPESDSTETFFHQTIEQSFQTANQAVNKWKSTALTLVNKMETVFAPKTGKGKDKAKKETASKKGKDEKKLPKFIEPEPDVKEAGSRLIAEWNCAISGEHFRSKLRLEMLLTRGKDELEEILNCAKKTFYGLFKDIHERYNRELYSVDTACELLAAAVEAEIPLQPILVLDGDKFYVDPNILLFPEALPQPDLPVKERDVEGIFTMDQLDVFTSILMDLAPNSSMPERAFVFLLQDMIVQNAEDGKETMVPLQWKKLHPSQVSQLSVRIFGDIEFIDWKDFIIYNFCLDFPSEENLLRLREEFRLNDPDATETVTNYQFFDTTLWFEGDFNEDDPQDMLRLKLIKDQIYKLYRVDEDTFNYTSFLLAFCKDKSLIKGFAKALTLALGKFVCWDPKIGNMYVESIRDQRLIDEKAELERILAHEEAIACADSIISDLVDTTVHVCDSVVIEDYVSETSSQLEVIHESVDRQRTSTELDMADFETGEVQELYTNEAGLSGESLTKNPELFLMDEEFVNAEIGFQPYYDTAKVYILPFDALLTVLTAALPWHARVQTLEDNSFRERVEVIYEKVKNLEFGNAVLTHELLNDKSFTDLLMSNFKFTIKNPPKIVAEMVEENSVIRDLVGSGNL